MRERRLPSKLLLGTAIAAVGTVGLGFFLSRRAVPDERITYPPLDVPKPLAADLWVVDSGPISVMGLKLPIRMTVVRLRDGSLLLHSPTRYTPALAHELDAIGTVRHLVAPNVAHWSFLADWQRAYPGATSWGVPGLRDRARLRRSGVRIDAELGDAAPAAWAEEIEQGIISGGGFQEAHFFHKASHTLLLTDLIENLEAGKLPPVTAMLMRATAATAGTTALHVRGALRFGGHGTREAIETMIGRKPERVIFAHGAFFTDRGAERLTQAFAWLR